MTSKIGRIQVSYTKTGIPKYQLEVSHKGLNKFEIVKGSSEYEVLQKANTKSSSWDTMWERAKERERRELDKAQKDLEKQKILETIEQKKSDAQDRTTQAQEALLALEKVLENTLDVDDRIDWEALKVKYDYPVKRPVKDKSPQQPVLNVSSGPDRSAAKYQPKINLLDKIFPFRKEAKLNIAAILFKKDFDEWSLAKERQIKRHEEEMVLYENHLKIIEEEYKNTLLEWESNRVNFIKKRDDRNAKIEVMKERYFNFNIPAITQYSKLVLQRSNYPEYFPKSFELNYNPDSKIMIVDYQLPAPADIPTLSEVKYVQSNDGFTEKHINESIRNKLYDNLLYQIALRTIHELYEADVINALQSIVFNGFVDSLDPATGQRAYSCVFSVQANREEFLEINLGCVHPKACFRKLKGVGSSKLHSLTPVAPVLKINKEDKRFVNSYVVTSKLNEGQNLAAMDWEDFEHLVRELFEKEFSSAGGEVKVTRASRDGGIDAVVFDPDPIRGGKIVIQAKRYTNVVGVSAVRDLYGTVVNEGANKGILVTTANYGPDAYEFAKGKPLTLLEGSNLLHLLEKYGQKFKIDLKEAKKILADNDN